MDGFLNLNKSAGFTSHDCIAKVRRSLKQKRVGHAGTLDPAATGVLPIALGRATRLLQFLPGDKAYRAIIRLGVTTATDDLAGEVLTRQPVDNLDLDAVKAALRQFEGTIAQVPPSYSAVQVGGKRLYDLARSGQEVVAPLRTVQVHRITLLDWRAGEFPELDLDIACGSGTYIRAIARDLGQILQTGGTLAALLRTESSGFRLSESLTLGELELALQQGTFEPILPQVGVQHLQTINLSHSLAKRWCHGQRLAWSDLETSMSPTAPLRVYHSGQFLGIGQRVEQEGSMILTPQVVLEEVKAEG